MKILENKIAIVTGAGSGLGKAISTLFASKGCRVLAADINQSGLDILSQEIKSTDGLLTTTLTNMAKADDIEKMIRLTLDTYGTIDILVNNAGIMDHFDAAGDLDDDMWER